ncbi:MAG TPA: feruloyl-CoA synthase [Thermoanaerobaculia bacterium]|nr:feruloyl-CoA synthase [Thermoanaerobaculia bacterium]
MTTVPRKPLRLAPPAVEVRRLANGGMVLRSRQELGAYPRCLGEMLRGWAREAPERTFLAEREAGGVGDGWRRVTYGAARDAVERIAGALVARDLPAGRTVAILSDNGVDSGLLQLAAMEVGIPAAPISPAYSLMSRDHARLRAIVELARPGLIYARDGASFAGALAALDLDGVEVVIGENPPAGRAVTAFAELLQGPPSRAAAARAAEVGPDTIAKILFTSGSTGKPKGVVNTQRMLCSNQQAIAQLALFLAERPPVIVDWLPWSHTFGGNHNFNMVLRHGGTLYIDGGKPLPGLIAMTLRNLREVPSTLHFNVPRGYDMLVPCLENDGALRQTFFGDLDALFFAAAALPRHLWERLNRLAIEATGRRVATLSAWGSTETAPCATALHFISERPDVIGLPVPGTEVKLAPSGGKLELRVKGPNVTPGYWRPSGPSGDPFDEDGFLRMGDAGKLADPGDPSQGIVFDGRLAENFKLTSGSWVYVGELRGEVITAAAPVVQDVVVTGHDRREVGLLVFPSLAGCRSLCAGAPPDAPLAELIRRPEVRGRLAAGLAAHNAANLASSRCIARALLLAEPPAMDAGEITDKGYVNQRAVLERRATLVERLYHAAADPEVIRLDDPAAGTAASSP